MNYTQFHEQFNRIFKLIYTDKEELISYLLDTRDRHGYDNHTDYVFYAKDFCCFSDFLQRQFLIIEFTAKDENGDWVLEQGNQTLESYEFLLAREKEALKDLHNKKLSQEYRWICQGEAKALQVEIELEPKTFRDLFLANCIPSNDPELDKIKLDNLKLINW